ncbi:hypothetical protein [Methanolobus halotolerans]|uniref:Uncharacterized protein n=1 Tax=Methanolobus halotolerans TaxID=2052935 RepID=A0A4E0PUL0_9EURY|nr:hypothetical protein [Methanolobus halotolerans]TGC06984.1 hypothetical protein CUN85_12320 [Methanolobus halotolerans]
MFVNFHCMNPGCQRSISKDIRRDRVPFKENIEDGESFSILSPCPECGYPNVLTIGSVGQVTGTGNQQVGAGDQLVGLENRLARSKNQLVEVEHKLISIR